MTLTYKNPLNQEQREALRDFKGSPEYYAFLKIIEDIVKAKEKAVLDYNVVTGSDRKLFALKAEAEGANAVLDEFKARIQQYVTLKAE